MRRRSSVMSVVAVVAATGLLLSGCTLDKKNSIGDLHCKICGQSFQTAINSLSQPVDIYSDWIDACEDVADNY